MRYIAKVLRFFREKLFCFTYENQLNGLSQFLLYFKKKTKKKKTDQAKLWVKPIFLPKKKQDHAKWVHTMFQSMPIIFRLQSNSTECDQKMRRRKCEFAKAKERWQYRSFALALSQLCATSSHLRTCARASPSHLCNFALSRLWHKGEKAKVGTPYLRNLNLIRKIFGVNIYCNCVTTRLIQT